MKLATDCCKIEAKCLQIELFPKRGRCKLIDWREQVVENGEIIARSSE